VKTFIFFSFLILNISTIFGQNIGFSGAYCANHYYDFKKNDGHFITEYKNGSGYSLNINLDSIILGKDQFRFSLHFLKYDGSIMTRDGGLAGGVSTKADITKYILGLTIFPININVWKELVINMGGDLNYLIYTNASGIKTEWGLGNPTKIENLEDRTIDIYNEFNLGIVTRIGYNIKVYKHWYLVPEYNFYFGLTNEFNKVEANVKSVRQYFTLGLMNRWN